MRFVERFLAKDSKITHRMIPQAKRNFLRKNISSAHYRKAPKYKITLILKNL
jgi:hypothetical protein